MAIDGGMRNQLTSGMRLVAKYRKQVYTADVIEGPNGKLRFRLADGQEFSSPSAAGQAMMNGILQRLAPLVARERRREMRGEARREVVAHLEAGSEARAPGEGEARGTIRGGAQRRADRARRGRRVVTTATETAEQIAILEEVLDLFDQAAELPRLPRNPRDRGLLPRRPQARNAVGWALRAGRAR